MGKDLVGRKVVFRTGAVAKIVSYSRRSGLYKLRFIPLGKQITGINGWYPIDSFSLFGVNSDSSGKYLIGRNVVVASGALAVIENYNKDYNLYKLVFTIYNGYKTGTDGWYRPDQICLV